MQVLGKHGEYIENRQDENRPRKRRIQERLFGYIIELSANNRYKVCFNNKIICAQSTFRIETQDSVISLNEVHNIQKESSTITNGDQVDNNSSLQYEELGVEIIGSINENTDPMNDLKDVMPDPFKID